MRKILKIFLFILCLAYFLIMFSFGKIYASENNSLCSKTKVLKLASGGFADGVDFRSSITILTPGFQEDASCWSNDGFISYGISNGANNAFRKNEHSIIFKLFEKFNGNLNLYYANMSSENIFQLYKYNQVIYYNNLEPIKIDMIDDVTKHSIVIFSPSDNEQTHERVYTEFHNLLDNLSLQYKSLSGVLPRYNLIGHSRGGIINIMYAKEHIYNVSSMFSIGTPYFGSNLGEIDALLNILYGNDEEGRELIEKKDTNGLGDILSEDTCLNLMNEWNEVYSDDLNMKIRAYGTITSLDLLKEVVDDIDLTSASTGSPLYTSLSEYKSLLSNIITVLNNNPYETETGVQLLNILFEIIEKSDRIQNWINTNSIENLTPDEINDIQKILDEVSVINNKVVIEDDFFIDLYSQLGINEETNQRFDGFIKKALVFGKNEYNENRAVHDLPGIPHNLSIMNDTIINDIIDEAFCVCDSFCTISNRCSCYEHECDNDCTCTSDFCEEGKCIDCLCSQCISLQTHQCASVCCVYGGCCSCDDNLSNECYCEQYFDLGDNVLGIIEDDYTELLNFNLTKAYIFEPTSTGNRNIIAEGCELKIYEYTNDGLFLISLGEEGFIEGKKYLVVLISFDVSMVNFSFTPSDELIFANNITINGNSSNIYVFTHYGDSGYYFITVDDDDISLSGSIENGLIEYGNNSFYVYLEKDKIETIILSNNSDVAASFQIIKTSPYQVSFTGSELNENDTVDLPIDKKIIKVINNKSTNFDFLISNIDRNKAEVRSSNNEVIINDIVNLNENDYFYIIYLSLNELNINVRINESLYRWQIGENVYSNGQIYLSRDGTYSISLFDIFTNIESDYSVSTNLNSNVFSYIDGIINIMSDAPIGEEIVLSSDDGDHELVILIGYSNEFYWTVENLETISLIIDTNVLLDELKILIINDISSYEIIRNNLNSTNIEIDILSYIPLIENVSLVKVSSVKLNNIVFNENNCLEIENLYVNNLFQDGTGTIDNPYIINSNRHFSNIRYAIQNQLIDGENKEVIDDHYIVCKQIFINGDFSALPILTGSLKSDSTVLRRINLINYMSGTAYESNGLFKGIYGGEVVNIGVIIHNTINVDGNYNLKSGVIAGYINGGLISNCYVEAEFDYFLKNDLYSIIGGIVGEVINGTILQCNSYVIVGTYGTVGGIAGVIYNGTISQCKNYGYFTLHIGAGLIQSENDNVSVGGIVGKVIGNASVINNQVYSWNEDPEYVIICASGTDKTNNYLNPYIGYVVGHNLNGIISGNYVSEDVLLYISGLTSAQQLYISSDINQHSGKDDTQ